MPPRFIRTHSPSLFGKGWCAVAFSSFIDLSQLKMGWWGCLVLLVGDGLNDDKHLPRGQRRDRVYGIVGMKTWFVGFCFVLLGLCVWMTVGGDSFVGEIFLYHT